MIEVATVTNQPVVLIAVSHMTTAFHAAHALWSSVHEAAKVYGGRALLRKPEDGEFGFLIFWEGGPEGWADEYAADPESSTPGFTVEAEDGVKIRFTDLD